MEGHAGRVQIQHPGGQGQHVADLQVGGDFLHQGGHQGRDLAHGEVLELLHQGGQELPLGVDAADVAAAAVALPDELLRLGAVQGLEAGFEGDALQSEGLLDVDFHAADGVDHVDEAVHVDGDVVVDGQAEPVVDDPGQVLHAPGVFVAVDGVDLAGGVLAADIGVPGNLEDVDALGLQVVVDHHDHVGELGAAGALGVVDAHHQEVDDLFLDLLVGAVLVADADGVAAFVHLGQRRPVEEGHIADNPRRHGDEDDGQGQQDLICGPEAFLFVFGCFFRCHLISLKPFPPSQPGLPGPGGGNLVITFH